MNTVKGDGADGFRVEVCGAMKSFPVFCGSSAGGSGEPVQWTRFSLIGPE